jgi:hypothetical protein
MGDNIKNGLEKQGLKVEVKRPWREANNSSPSIAEFKNVQSSTYTRQYVFMAWYLVKYRDNYTFTFRFLLDWTGSEQGPVAGSCKDGNELSVSRKIVGNFLTSLGLAAS